MTQADSALPDPADFPEPVDFEGRTFLLLGHSHVRALALAVVEDSGCLNGARLRMPPGPPHEAQYWRDVMRFGAGSHLVLLARGNEGNKLGIRAADDPFDICPSGGIPPAATDGHGAVPLVPESRARALLQPMVDETRIMLKIMRRARPASLTLMETPPPVPFSPRLMRSFLAFPGSSRQGRMGSDGMRLRLHRLAWRMRADLAAALGVGVANVPPETLDGEGMLRPDFADDSGTHGTADYGRLAWRAIMGAIRAQTKPQRTAAA